MGRLPAGEKNGLSGPPPPAGGGHKGAVFFPAAPHRAGQGLTRRGIKVTTLQAEPGEGDHPLRHFPQSQGARMQGRVAGGEESTRSPPETRQRAPQNRPSGGYVHPTKKMPPSRLPGAGAPAQHHPLPIRAPEALKALALGCPPRATH